MKRDAVVLLSGGLDSAVTLFFAKSKGYACHCLVLDYGQRHKRELCAARKIASIAGADVKVVKLNLSWKGSSLLDKSVDLPLDRSPRSIQDGGIPSTYVPGRNTIFLSLAASYAEAVGAGDIFIGAHVQDSSGYPDCREKYLRAFDRVIKLGTKCGNEGHLRLKFPLIRKTKSRIIDLGRRLRVPFELTRSCYSAAANPCGRCDSCILRAKGFEEAGMADPAIKKNICVQSKPR
jgi:7-cyano-7-deazaguanine synthase